MQIKTWFKPLAVTIPGPALSQIHPAAQACGIKSVVGNLGRFHEETFLEFVPESFRWTDYMSRPGAKLWISDFLLEIGQVFPQAPYSGNLAPRGPFAETLPTSAESSPSSSLLS